MIAIMRGPSACVMISTGIMTRQVALYNMSLIYALTPSYIVVLYVLEVFASGFVTSFLCEKFVNFRWGLSETSLKTDRLHTILLDFLTIVKLLT